MEGEPPTGLGPKHLRFWKDAIEVLEKNGSKAGEVPPDKVLPAAASAEVEVREDVARMRTGAIADPTVGQVAALAAAFGVAPSCLVDRGRDPSVLDGEALAALSDETANVILRESARLPERERRIVLGIVRQFAEGDRAPS